MPTRSNYCVIHNCVHDVTVYIGLQKGVAN